MARRKEELQFNSQGEVCLDSILEERKPSTIEYVAPPNGKKWKAVYAVLFMPWHGAVKAVMGCLISLANPKHGACYPSHAFIMKRTGCSKRSVERAIPFLRRTPYLRAQQRGTSSNGYVINWEALNAAFDAGERNVKRTAISGESCEAANETFQETPDTNRHERLVVAAISGDPVPPQVDIKTVKINSKGKQQHEVVRSAEEADPTCMFECPTKEATKKDVDVGPLTSPTTSLQASTPGDPHAALLADLLDRGTRAAVEWMWGVEAVYHAAIDAEVLSRGAGALLVLEEYRKHMREEAAA
jgi:hypothetical protein